MSSGCARREAPSAARRPPPLPRRRRYRRADSRRRRPAGANPLPRRSAERLARPAGATAAAQRMAAPRRRARRRARPSSGSPRRTPSSPTRPRPPSGCARSCAKRPRADAPPRITGIGRAFHVAGLAARRERDPDSSCRPTNNRPISISVLRRPNEQPRWAVSLTEVIDERRPRRRATPCSGIASPARCPPQLPRQSLSEASAEEARAIEADYRLVMDEPRPLRAQPARRGARSSPARRRRRRNRDRCPACAPRRAAR